MMRRFIVCSLFVYAVVMGVVCFAQDAVTAESAIPQAEKDLLISNIIALRNKEMRVAVLRQLLNEERNSLSQMEAVFCDQYKLSIDKFRAGEYIYNEAEGKFVEKPAVEEKAINPDFELEHGE